MKYSQRDQEKIFILITFAIIYVFLTIFCNVKKNKVNLVNTGDFCYIFILDEKYPITECYLSKNKEYFTVQYFKIEKNNNKYSKNDYTIKIDYEDINNRVSLSNLYWDEFSYKDLETKYNLLNDLSLTELKFDTQSKKE